MTGSADYPWAISAEDRELRCYGSPRILVGGQVYNSSSSSRDSISRSFAQARRINSNTVLAPVSWALTEPLEGEFDFGLVNHMLDEARRLGLRLVLLWFGAFKNAASTYSPRWVRADRERFPRAVVNAHGIQAFSYEGATPKPVLSVFGAALREADARAFEALLSHLSDVDSESTVAMIQVENESGLLGDSRDRSPEADAAWSANVPQKLLDFLPTAPGDTSLARRIWDERGSKITGSWSEVFGEDDRADEVFMAWGFASYVEHLAARGQAIRNVPMYANAWLGPQPGQDRPGQWPSGGPASRVLEVWQVAAPSLALLGPDVYVDDTEAALRTYASASQPLFVPESKLNAAELVRAIGRFGAIGWSAFGIDGANPDGQVAAVLGFVAGLEDDILRARQNDAVTSVVIEPDTELSEVRIGRLEITVRGTLALFQRMLLDAGVQVPDPEISLPSETTPIAPVPSPGDTRPFGLVLRDGDELIIIGQGLTLDFVVAESRIEIDFVEEILVEGGTCDRRAGAQRR